ncbi:MAG: hypothetical protein IJZ56_05195 [Oscillospiraceae bacterium]|nr:hypothetical protein [Oscillospiraceae bacterium]MBQ8797569.1 hypothetical protein [Oscillospiraceae bacterium]
MKKSLALALSIILILGLFVGCNKDAADSTTTAATEAPAEPAGTLYLSFGPALEVSYDDAGNVLQITGTNEAGKTIAAESADQVGRGCVFAARKFLRCASDNKLLGDAKSMVVRVDNDDPLPTEDFLDTIVTDCQYLADEECTGIQMMKITVDDLDSDGNILPATAKRLAARFLGITESDLQGEETVVDGFYNFSCGDATCAVDAFTGLVTKK